MPVVPVVLLAPRLEEAEVERFHVEDRHVAALVGVSADGKVQERGERLGAAARVAGPCGDELLDAGVSAGRVDHRAATCVVLVPARHLLVVHGRIQVVHLLVRAAVGPGAIRMFAHLVAAVELEALRALVDELLEVLEPWQHPVGHVVLRALQETVHLLPVRGLLLPLCVLRRAGVDAVVLPRLGDVVRNLNLTSALPGEPGGALLLVAKEVIVAAEPQRELHADALHGRNPGVPAHRGPVGEVEALRVPLLVDGEVIELLHPAGLQSVDVAGDVTVAELHALVDHVVLVDVLVGHVREAVAPHGQERRTPAQQRVRVEERRIVLAEEHVEVDLSLRRLYRHDVRVLRAHVPRVAPGRVHEYAPSVAAQRHRHRDVALDVAHPDFIALAPAHDLLAAAVAKAIDAFAFRERERDRETLADRARRDRHVRARDARLDAHRPLRGVHAQIARRSPDRPALARECRTRPVGLQDPVAVEAGLRPAVGPALPHAEEVFRQHVHAQLGGVRKLRHDALSVRIGGFPHRPAPSRTGRK